MAGGNDFAQDTKLPENIKVWIMPAILEGFGLAGDFKCFDAFYDHKSWQICCEFGAAGVVLTVGGILWAVFRKRIAELWPWHQLRIVRAELAQALQENSELRKFFPVQLEKSRPLETIQTVDFDYLPRSPL